MTFAVVNILGSQPGWLSAITVVVLLFIALTMMAYMTYYERKVIAFMQDRLGPTRTGPRGLLQPAADGLKLLFKEDIIPSGADRWVFFFAPIVVFVTALAAFMIIPLGGTAFVPFTSKHVNLFLTDLNVGLLLILALGGIGVYGIILGGYASANRYSLIGGLRSAAQVISYELTLGLALVGVMLLSGSLSLVDIVNWQRAHVWIIVFQPAGFILYLISAIAETNRAPFDLPEAENELVAGFHTEYSGFRFSMFFLGEYINMLVVSGIAATVFLGGWDGPILPGPIWLFIKMLLFMFVYIWLRATLPRFRYDQLMGIAWKVLLPLTLANILVTATVKVIVDRL
ncbi:MAG: NADH-quinone oxidoreductase subunit NuoH [Thermomicrobiales bacterium]